jgi:hypothetical protein
MADRDKAYFSKVGFGIVSINFSRHTFLAFPRVDSCLGDKIYEAMLISLGEFGVFISLCDSGDFRWR